MPVVKNDVVDVRGGRVRRAFPRRIRAGATDLDGTLLRSDGTLSCFTRSVLRSSRRGGFPVIAATARTPRAVRRIVGHEELGVVVCANGAIVWDAASDQVVSDRCFEPASLIEALRSVRSALPAAGFALLSADAMFIDDAYRRLRGTGVKDAELVDDVTAVLAGARIALVAVRHPDMGAAEFVDFASAAFGDAGSATFASHSTVDICPNGSSKATSVADVLAGVGCHGDATVAFGDMPNDLPLLAWAGWACAVQNADAEVLRAADEVIPPNDEDGVARTLQRLFDLSV
jgi:Cof subfamily protein (haloacid dehalogenase superfamily)